MRLKGAIESGLSRCDQRMLATVSSRRGCHEVVSVYITIGPLFWPYSRYISFFFSSDITKSFKLEQFSLEFETSLSVTQSLEIYRKFIILIIIICLNAHLK